jgi:hypothetical protein
MKIQTSQDLDNAIIELERRKVIQQSILKEQYRDTVDHFKPKNLLKSAFNNILEPSDTRTTLLKAAGGLGVGLLTKNLLLGKTTSVIGKLASNALKLTATNSVINNTDKITAWGTAIFHNLFSKKNKK